MVGSPYSVADAIKYSIVSYSVSSLNITNNTISNCSYGIDLNGVTGSAVSGNTIRLAQNYSIYSSGATGNNFTNNNLTNSTYGAYFTADSTGNTLTNNTACANTNTDIYDLDSNTGINNTCNSWYNFADSGQPFGCMYACPGTWFSVAANSPADYNFANTSTPQFNYTVSGSIANYTCHLLINGTGYNTSVAQNGIAKVVTANNSIAPDGVYQWQVNCTYDSMTNSSAARTITIDTTHPALNFTLAPANNSYLTRNWTEINISINETNLDTFVFNWNGSTNATCNITACDNGNITGTAPNRWFFINKTDLADGTYTYYGQANDSAGNQNWTYGEGNLYNSTQPRYLKIDTTNPAVSITYPANGQYFNTKTITINGTTIDTNLNYTNVSIFEKFGCYDNETQVLTDGGWKYFRELSGGEKVLTLNSENGETEFNKPTEYQTYDYDGQMYKIRMEDPKTGRLDKHLPKQMVSRGLPIHVGDLLVSPEHKVYAGINPSLFSSSFVLNTSTLSCCLNSSSSDQIGELSANANAKYGSSFVTCLPCGEILLASGKNLSYTFSGNDSIFRSSKVNKNANTRLLTLPDFFIFSLLSASSSKTNSGEISLHPKFGNFSMTFLLAESFLKNENNTQASTIRSLGSCSDIFGYNQCLAATLSLSSEPHFSAISSVISEFFSKSSANLNINLSDSRSLIALEKTEFTSALSSSSNPGSSSLGILTTNSIFSNNISSTYKNTFSLQKVADLPTDQPIYFLDQHLNHVKVQSIEKTPYTGKIYDVTVPNHILLVKRNGTPVWSGNSFALVNSTLNYSQNWSWTVNITHGDGMYYINATAYDNATNSNTTSINVTIDTTYPSLNFTNQTPANNSYLTRNWTAVNISITELNLDTFKFYWNGTLDANCNSTTCNSGTIAGTAPNYQFFINKTDLADGTYTYYGRANDSAGNQNWTYGEGNLYNSTQPRYLTIDTTPPGGVMGLNATLMNYTWIWWNWTNPSNGDFNHTEIWIDGNWTENQTGSPGAMGFYNLTGLEPGTGHTIGTRTVDNLGNVNRTWVNNTANTTADIIIPVINSLDVNSTWLNTNITIIANVTDDYRVAAVRANISAPDSTSEIINLANQSPNIYRATYNLTKLGAYTITLYANDTSGNNATEWLLVRHSLALPAKTDKTDYYLGQSVSFYVNVTDGSWFENADNISACIVNGTAQDCSGAVYNITLTNTSTGVYTGAWQTNSSYSRGNYSAFVSAWKNGLEKTNASRFTLWSRIRINMSQPEEGDYDRGIIPVRCNVTTFYDEATAGYPVMFWVNGTNEYNATTNASGVASYLWNASNVTAGQYMLNCTIETNASGFYNATINNDYAAVNMYATITAQFNITPSSGNLSRAPGCEDIGVPYLISWNVTDIRDENNNPIDVSVNVTWMGGYISNATSGTYDIGDSDTDTAGDIFRISLTKGYYHGLTNTSPDYAIKIPINKTVVGWNEGTGTSVRWTPDKNVSVGADIEYVINNYNDGPDGGPTITIDLKVRDNLLVQLGSSNFSKNTANMDVSQVPAGTLNTAYTNVTGLGGYCGFLGLNRTYRVIGKYDHVENVTWSPNATYCTDEKTCFGNITRYPPNGPNVTLVGIVLKDNLNDTIPLSNTSNITFGNWSASGFTPGQNMTSGINFTLLRDIGNNYSYWNKDDVYMLYPTNIKVTYTVYGMLNVTSLSTSSSTVYQNACNAPTSVLLNATTLDDHGAGISGANVTFYEYNGTAWNNIGSNTTVNGNAQFSYTPSGHSVGNFTIKANVTKPYYNQGSEANMTVLIKSCLKVDITLPLNATTFGRGDNVNVTANITGPAAAVDNATVNCTFAQKTNSSNVKIVNMSYNAATKLWGGNYTFLSNDAIDDWVIKVNASKDYYDSAQDNITVILYTKLNLTLNVSPTTIYRNNNSGVNVTRFTANVTDEEGNSPTGLTVNFYENGTYIGSNTTSSGIATFGYNPAETHTPENFTILANVTGTNYQPAADTKWLAIRGVLNVSMDTNTTRFYRKDTYQMNSTIMDENNNPVTPSFTWYLNTTLLNQSEDWAWTVPQDQTVGPYTLMVNVSKDWYDPDNATSNIDVWGRLNSSTVSPSQDQNFNRTDIIRVKANLTNEIEVVNAATVNSTIVNTANQTDYRNVTMAYNATSELWEGSYTTKANDSIGVWTVNVTASKAYYNPTTSLTNITINRVVNLSLNVSPSTIYRNNNSGANTTLLAANVTDEAGGVSGLTVTFYENETAIGSNTTSSGIATFGYNPAEDHTPGNFTIKANVTGSYTSAASDTKWLAIMGVLNLTMDTAETMFYRKDTYQMNSTIMDENNNPVTPSFTWYLNSTLLNQSEDWAWTVPQDQTVGPYTLMVNASKDWYDPSNKTSAVEVWGRLNVSIVSPTGSAQVIKGQVVNITANVTDENGTISALNYINCTFEAASVSYPGLAFNSSTKLWKGTRNTTTDTEGEVRITVNVSKTYYDNATSSVNITLVRELFLSLGMSTDHIYRVSGIGAENVTFTANVTDIEGQAEDGLTVSFYENVSGSYSILGSNTTSSGIATLYYNPADDHEIGNFTILANVTADYSTLANDTKRLVIDDIYFGVITQDQSVARTSNITIKANVTANVTKEPLDNINCQWSVDGQQIFNSTTSNGICNYTWPNGTQCSYLLGGHNISVYVSDTSYTNDNNAILTLNDSLVVSITYPTADLKVYRGSAINLNATVNDSCGYPSNNYTNMWWNETGYDIANGTNAIWAIPPAYARGPETITANASGQYYEMGRKNVTIKVFGYANVSEITPANATYYTGQAFVLSCKVIDEFSQGIPGYNVRLYVNGPELGGGRSPAQTNGTGYATFAINVSTADNIYPGLNNLTCNITEDNTSLYYTPQISSQQANITDIDTIRIVNLTLNPTIVYRHDSLYPYLINISGKVRYAEYGDVPLAAVHVFDDLGETTALTDSNGSFTMQYNTGLLPGNHTLLINATKAAGIYSNKPSETYARNITVLGALSPNITSPANGSVLHRGDKNIGLNSTIYDADNNLINGSNVAWYTTQEVIGSEENLLWNVSDSYPLGIETLSLNASKDYYDSGSDNISMEIWGWSNITLTSPTALNWSYGETINITCIIRDVNTGGLLNYTVYFYDGGTLLNVTNSTAGTATYMWTPKDWNTSDIGLHDIVCNITDDPAQYYNKSQANEGNVTVNISDTTKPNITYADVYPVGAIASDEIVFSADVTDNILDGVDRVWVTIIQPNTTAIDFQLNRTSGNHYNNSDTFAANGTYIVTFYANDTSGLVANKSGYNFTITSKTTVGAMIIPVSSNATDVKYAYGQNITVDMVCNNLLVRAFAVNITNITLPSGWGTNFTKTACGTLESLKNCTTSARITIPANGMPGTYAVTSACEWTNPDDTYDSSAGYGNVTVFQNPVLDIIEDSIAVTIAPNSSNTVSFNINSTGNYKLDGIAIECLNGTVCENFSVTFTPSSVVELPQGLTQAIAVNVSVPLGYLQGAYNGTIFANATASNCTSSRCTDTVEINVTITEMKTWSRTPDLLAMKNVVDNETGTLGDINITNTANVNLNFTVSSSGNISPMLVFSNITVPRMESKNLSINYSIPLTQTPGIYNGVIIIDAENGSAPSQLNVSVSINVTDATVPTISNFTITTPSTPNVVDVNYENLTISVNVTDNIGVDRVYANITDGVSSYIQMGNASADTWQLSHTANVSGVYHVVIAANDTSGNTAYSDMLNFTAIGNTTGEIIAPGIEVNGTVFDETNSFNMSVTFNNTGLGGAYGTNITLGLPSVFSGNTTRQCGKVEETGSCGNTFNITVAAATYGVYYINSTAAWMNPDNTQGVATQTTLINVTANPVLSILETNISRAVQNGTEENIGRITLHSLGNYKLENITLKCSSGAVCENFTVTFGSANFDMEPNATSEVSINVSVPGATPVHQTYNGTILVNATGSGSDASWGEIPVYIYVYFAGGILSVSNTSITATNVTEYTPYQFDLTLNVTNTGSETAENVTLTLSNLQTGFYANTTSQGCGNLSANESCARSFAVNVTADAPPNTYIIEERALWLNPNEVLAVYATNTTSVTVEPNARIDIPETNLSATIKHGETKEVGEFTLKSIGNKFVADLVYTNTGGDIPSAWITYNDTRDTIPRATSRKISVNVSVPSNTTYGNYSTTLLINSSNGGYDTLELNVSVPMNTSWMRTPENLSRETPAGTSGNFTVYLNNSGNVDINMNVTAAGNASIQLIYSPSFPTVKFVQRAGITEFIIKYFVPADQPLGMYVANITFFANSTFDPEQASTMVYMNVTDPPPNITDAYVKPIADVNETVTISANVTDNYLVGSVWANVNGTIRNMSKNDSTYSAAYKPERAGFYNITIYANDTKGGISTAVLNFTAVGNTTLNMTVNVSATVQGITQREGQNLTMNVTLANTGLATAINANVTLSLNWSATPSQMGYGNISNGTSITNSSVISVPNATAPGLYTINITAGWRNPDGTIGAEMTNVTINVTENPVLEVPSSKTFAVAQNTTNTTPFTINSTGNVQVGNITIGCMNCTAFNITIAPSSIASLGAGNSTDINITATAPQGYAPGMYNMTANFTSSAGEANMTLYLIVPSDWAWVRTPESMTLDAAAVGTNGSTSINITNIGNIAIEFNVSLGGNTTAFSAPQTILVAPLSTASLVVNYSAIGAGTHTVYVTMANGSANPPSRNTSITLPAVFLSINVTAPTEASPATNVLAGGILEINATLLRVVDNATEITGNVTWHATVGGANCTNLSAAYSSGWRINCTLPPLNTTNNSLVVNASYSGFNASALEQNAVIYRDVDPPYVTYKYVQNVAFPGRAIIQYNVSDNVGVALLVVNVSGTVYNTTNDSILLNLTLSEGDYKITLNMTDTSGNSNTTTDYLEVYQERGFWGNITDANGAPVNATFMFYKPINSELAKNITTLNGTYNTTLHARTYDLEITAFNTTLSLNEADLSAANDPIDLDNLPLTGIPFKNPVQGIAMSTTFNESGSIVMHYSQQYLDSHGYVEANLRIYQCANWTYLNRTCSGWEEAPSAIDFDANNITANVAGFSTSAYVLVEEEDSWAWGVTPVIISKAVTVGTNGSLGSFLIQNNGNKKLNFSILVTGNNSAYFNVSDSYAVVNRGDTRVMNVTYLSTPSPGLYMETASIAIVPLNVPPLEIEPARNKSVLLTINVLNLQQVTGLKATNNVRSIGLSWNANTDTTIAYQVHRSTAIDFTPANATLLNTVYGINTTGYNDTSARTGITYYYKVLAQDAGNNTSPESSQVHETLYCNYTLKKGWNLISLPLNVTGATAEDLIINIGSAKETVSWDDAAQSYTSHVGGIVANDFPLENGRGYWVNLKNDTIWSFTGYSYLTNVTLNLSPIWNLVSWINETGKTAQEICSSVNATSILYYNASRGYYKVYYCPGMAGDNFMLNNRNGYWIEMPASGQWKASMSKMNLISAVVGSGLPPVQNIRGSVFKSDGQTPQPWADITVTDLNNSGCAYITNTSILGVYAFAVNEMGCANTTDTLMISATYNNITGNTTLVINGSEWQVADSIVLNITPGVDLILDSPANGATDLDGNVTFAYRVNSAYGCWFYMNDTYAANISASDGSNNFTRQLDDGNYTWNLECYWPYGPNYSVTSDTRTLAVDRNITLPAPVNVSIIRGIGVMTWQPPMVSQDLMYIVYVSNTTSGFDTLATTAENSINLSGMKKYYQVKTYFNGKEDNNTDIFGTDAINLTAGWSVFSLPFDEPYNASGILEAADCKILSKYEGGIISHIRGSPAFDFPLEIGRGYYIFCQNQSKLSFGGRYRPSINVSLSQGWNMVGSVPTNISGSAELCSKTGCIAVSKYDAGFQMSNFSLSTGGAYFVYTGASGVVELG
ncbi:MAG: hypothetical protein MSIBF_00355 [Candidatus Altiarchaeales archaeon IMC4]|nr:MAG: hypothetical protein MSIBF_00355 [Candidatus Altiarchaeales archaeon IMC4]